MEIGETRPPYLFVLFYFFLSSLPFFQIKTPFFKAGIISRTYGYLWPFVSHLISVSAGGLSNSHQPFFVAETPCLVLFWDAFLLLWKMAQLYQWKTKQYLDNWLSSRVYFTRADSEEHSLKSEPQIGKAEFLDLTTSLYVISERDLMMGKPWANVTGKGWKRGRKEKRKMYT